MGRIELPIKSTIKARFARSIHRVENRRWALGSAASWRSTEGSSLRFFGMEDACGMGARSPAAFMAPSSRRCIFDVRRQEVKIPWCASTREEKISLCCH
jgi:hypothetical protein